MWSRSKVKVSEIATLPELSPKRDDEFMKKLDGAVSGALSMYYAAVPLALCVPFDLDYRPDLHAIGAQAIKQVASDWKQGNFQKLFVYQRGRWFIVSDDYIPLFAALSGLPDYVPCWVLGKPDSELVRDIQGPLKLDDVAKLLGVDK